jgi:hypothetical protein
VQVIDQMSVKNSLLPPDFWDKCLDPKVCCRCWHFTHSLFWQMMQETRNKELTDKVISFCHELRIRDLMDGLHPGAMFPDVIVLSDLTKPFLEWVDKQQSCK